MKIGILTVPFNNNYGGLLQAYALKSVLQKMGHEVLFINRQRPEPKILKYRLYKLMVKSHLINDYLGERSKRISRYTDAFKTKYLEPISEPFSTTEDLKKCIELGIDFFIVGSDQVWRFAYAEDTLLDFFFGFLPDSFIPRISYAASFGIDIMDYPLEIKKEASRLLTLFIGISVREESGLKMLSELGVDSRLGKVVLDPTFLLSPENYKDLFAESRLPDGPYIFTYVLDRYVVSDETVNCLCCQLKMRRVDMRAQTGKISQMSTIAPVEDWLQGICESDGVITDSFHGTVFSIIFNKPFLVVANPNRGVSRLQSLLNMFRLDKRLITKASDLTENRLFSPIDWDFVNSRISVLKNQSLEFLTESLISKT